MYKTDLFLFFRFTFSGCRSVPSNNLRRVNLRANYQILKNEYHAPYALIASHRLKVLKQKKKCKNFYDLSNTFL